MLWDVEGGIDENNMGDFLFPSKAAVWLSLGRLADIPPRGDGDQGHDGSGPVV